MGAFDLSCRAGYVAFLSATERALRTLEPAVEARALRLLPDWPERRRLAAVRCDLMQLGLALPDPPAPAPDGSGDWAAWGILYVLEGSRLGNRYLRRIVEAAAPPECRAAGRYLAHGEGAPLWQVFLTALGQAEAVGDPRAAVFGAREAFEVFDMAAQATAAGRSPAEKGAA